MTPVARRASASDCEASANAAWPHLVPRSPVRARSTSFNSPRSSTYAQVGARTPRSIRLPPSPGRSPSVRRISIFSKMAPPVVATAVQNTRRERSASVTTPSRSNSSSRSARERTNELNRSATDERAQSTNAVSSHGHGRGNVNRNVSTETTQRLTSHVANFRASRGATKSPASAPSTPCRVQRGQSGANDCQSTGRGRRRQRK